MKISILILRSIQIRGFYSFPFGISRELILVAEHAKLCEFRIIFIQREYKFQFLKRSFNKNQWGIRKGTLQGRCYQMNHI